MDRPKTTALSNGPSTFRMFNERAIREDMATAVCKTPRKLRCNGCGDEKKIGKNAVAKYLRKGWPTCCGQTMELL